MAVTASQEPSGSALQELTEGGCRVKEVFVEGGEVSVVEQQECGRSGGERHFQSVCPVMESRYWDFRCVGTGTSAN